MPLKQIAITGWLLSASHFDGSLAVQPDSCILARDNIFCDYNQSWFAAMTPIGIGIEEKNL